MLLEAPRRDGAVLFPSGEHSAVRKGEDRWEGAGLRETRRGRRSWDKSVDAFAVRPDGVLALGIRGKRDVHSGAEFHFGLAGMREIDVVLAAPRGRDSTVVQRDAAAIHGTCFQLPCAFTLFH